MENLSLVALTQHQYDSLISKIDDLYRLVADKQKENSIPVLLTTKEVAKRLKCCEKTVINYIDSGKLPSVKFDSDKRQRHKIWESDLIKFLKIYRY